MVNILTANITEVHQVPINIITRPIKSSIDEAEVEEIVKVLENPNRRAEVSPLVVLWVQDGTGGNYYFSFSGDAEFEAHKRRNSITVPCKIIPATPEVIHSFLGASMPIELH